MDLDNIFSKIESNADAIGGLVGGFGTLSWYSKLYGRDLGATIGLIVDKLLSDPHFPNLQHLWKTMSSESQNIFKTSLLAWVLGYGLDAVDIDPKISRLGKALQKAGFASILGSLAVNVIVYSSIEHSSSSSGGGKSGLVSLWGGS